MKLIIITLSIDPSIGNGIFAEDQYLGSFENSEEDSPISSGSSSSSGSSTKGPNVIFPSIENKPIVVNTTFTYNLGRNADKIIVSNLWITFIESFPYDYNIDLQMKLSSENYIIFLEPSL